jgi:hypothetical protein
MTAIPLSISFFAACPRFWHGAYSKFNKEAVWRTSTGGHLLPVVALSHFYLDL